MCIRDRSEPEIVQVILEGGTPQERSSLVFAERPRCFADLDRLCVMSRAIQSNDESRGPGVARKPDLGMAERRAGQSQSQAALPVGGSGNNFRNMVCFRCNKTGHISRHCPEGRTSPMPSTKVPNPKNGATRGR